jgi:HAD superfamily phosphatase (TIGR01668 family)
MLDRFCPQLVAPRLTDLTPAFFADRGLRALILDLDNTIVPWKGAEISPEVQRWVEELLRAGVRLCICSNTRRPRRLAALADQLGVPYIERVAKPRRRGFLQALELMEARPDETAVVGDQVMTDIWGGNRCGLTTILVEPISRVEFLGTRIVSRPVEALLLGQLRRRGLLREWSPAQSAGRTEKQDG